MAGSTIGSKLTISTTLGSTAAPGVYLSPLTITPTGDIVPSDYGVSGLSASISLGYVLNQGAVSGGVGKQGEAVGDGGAGGGGVGLSAGSLTNIGTVTGGSGGGGTGGGEGGHGGYGIDLAAALLTNSGNITGGDGGFGENNNIIFGYGGAGGTGAILASGILLNGGTISGGIGGGGIVGGAGGIGLILDEGSLINLGVIIGGRPGHGSSLGESQNLGGGVGAAIYAGNLTNTGTISGWITALGGSPAPDGMMITGGNVVNRGAINGGNASVGLLGEGVPGGDGVTLAAGSLINDGMINGGRGSYGNFFGGTGGAGVTISGGVLTNHGTIAGARGSELGEIDGNGGIGVDLSAGSLINDGTITGGSVPFGGYGGIGVNFDHGGTLTNVGLIVGGIAATIADAVDFGAGASRLILEPGATFSGAVVANPAYSNVLQLVSGNTIGAIGGLGSAIDGFGTIAIDQGASWIIAGNSAGLSAGQTIEGFAKHDDIQLTGISATGSSYAEGVLTLTLASGSVALNIPGTFTTSDFLVDNFGGDTFISITCFRAGTRICTVNGKVPVERLWVGELVLVLGRDGDLVPQAITWIGHRSIDCERHPRPDQVRPVRIRAGAFGGDVPSRDVFLSPDHAVFVDGMLIPVKRLINGGSIVQVPMNKVSYFHVELQEHSVLLADDLPTESYLDTGDRASFANGGERLALFADFAARAWESAGCAPLVVTGARLDAVRRRIDGGEPANRRANQLPALPMAVRAAMGGTVRSG